MPEDHIDTPPELTPVMPTRGQYKHSDPGGKYDWVSESGILPRGGR